MKIEEINFYPRNLEFKKPFITSSQKIKQRKVFIIELKDEAGNTGFGEAAPLHTFSKETFLDLELEIKKIKKQLPKIFDDELFLFGKKIKSLTDFSTLRFAFEQAFFNLLIKRKKIFLDDNFSREIKVNAVVPDADFEERITSIRNYVEEGFDTIKLKFGNKDFNSEMNFLEKVRNEFPNVNLRLDVNGVWTFEEAVSKIKELEKYNIQYIEQPVLNSEEILRLAEISPVQIAPDESIRNFLDAEKFLNHDSIKFIVIKPMFAGGITEILKIIDVVEKKEKVVIISSALESGIGKSALVWIAAQTKHKYAHGLGTGNFLKDDPNSDFFKPEKGKIKFNRNNYLRNIENLC